jgi:predicted dinucleotide-binding enzyme
MKIAILGTGSVGQRLYQLISPLTPSVQLCARKPELDRPDYAQGAQAADMVLLALPFTALTDVLPGLEAALKGKIVVDCTNPLHADWSPLLLGQEHSAGEETARLLPGSRVVKAFNTIFADVMTTDRQDRGGLRTTAFIAGDDAQAKSAVLSLARQAGFEPLDVGPLRMARHLESMAHLNIQIAVGQKGGTNAAFVYHQQAA